MNGWKQHWRFGVIAVASFVLLITVLPQVASSLGLHVLGARLASTATCGSSGSSGNSGSSLSGSSGSSGSSMCCSGSSGSSGSSSSVACGPGTITGTVTVTGAPAGFSPAYLGAGACPASTPSGQMCADPQYTLAPSNGAYSLSLPAGTWVVAGFYENNGFGGVFLGASVTVTIPSGGTITRNLTVPYEAPASVTGTVTVVGAPSFDPVEEFSVLLCPSFAPYDGTTTPLACVSTYSLPPTPGASSATFSVSGLPPGTWTAYPGYCARAGCRTNASAGKTVTLVSNTTATVNVSTNFILPGEGLLEGTVTVTGAPSGFTNLVGVTACRSGNQNCQSFYGTSGNSYDLLLTPGSWTVKGFYLASPFDNAVDGPTETVSVSDGHTTVANLNVPYQVPGSATGTITVAGLPKGITVESYTVLACPAADPWTGGLPAPECLSEYSGPGGFGYGAADRANASPSSTSSTSSTSSKSSKTSAGAAKKAAIVSHPPAGFAGKAISPPYNSYLIAATPGQWLLYAGYTTVFGSVIDHQGSPLVVRAGKTTRSNLRVPYQAPSQGAVLGVVNVIGAPANSFQTGVQACTAPPTATTCQGETDAYSQQGGSYALLVSPGTWWVRGFVDVFSVNGLTRSTSASVVVQVKAGAEQTQNFTVTAS